ncbi:MAG: hypothetical protein OW723_02025 [Buchnera aphidicola (Acyrthosiphon caraganae)]|jgi:uncharacterized lipoprotein|uniref:hypothetical protein n=1 Tax=Buchnera aphidicola TaxID=9 RepID=UPI00030B1ABC|nr:hypothetical protein [Buchnera aphidicola]WAI18186.1 MAG: hypothetical protein OW723_02025 [Buchnera aphidicola (Acyrthosiphon caraganae)]
MLILKNYRKFLKIVIIFQILNIFLITSCTLKDFNKYHDCNEIKNQFKKLIIPEGINLPNKKEEYNIPYTEKDLEKENRNIFPPI